MKEHRVSTDELPELLRSHPDGPLRVLGPDPSGRADLLTVTVGLDPFVVHAADLIVDLDVGLPLEVARERCLRAGLLLPFPIGPQTMLEALLSAPAQADAWVRDVDGVDRQGARTASPVSPRAAVGPDPVGGMLLPSLLLLPTRVRVRTVPASRTQVVRAEVEDAAAATVRVLDAMAAGRAFVVGAVASEVRLTLGSSSLAEGAGASPAMSPLPGGPARRGFSLGGASAARIEEVMRRGGLVLGAPQQGRLLAFDDEAPEPVGFASADDAAEALAVSLTQAAAQASAAEAQNA